MTNFLFNIKNHYLRVAIAELVDEAMKAAGRPHYQFSQQWDAGSTAQQWREKMVSAAAEAS
ncbi:hypothetical protein VSP76_21195, partial [Klebsiella pneumoniae]|nr:hypothetical protein [Klebsiella pneumoniae]